MPNAITDNCGNSVVEIQSFVFFDLESTGLLSPGCNPRVTELCFLALTRNEISMKNEPRVINKLSLCFNPQKRIPPRSSIITGLHNEALEPLETFKGQALLILEFLRILPKPACLIAHNGNRFDFPLLVAQLKTSGFDLREEVLCADSLEAFRTFDGLSPVPEFVLKQRQNQKNVVCKYNPKTDSESEHQSYGATSVKATEHAQPNIDQLHVSEVYKKSPPRKRKVPSQTMTNGDSSLEFQTCGNKSHEEDSDSKFDWSIDNVTPAKKISPNSEPKAPRKTGSNPLNSDVPHSIRQNLFGRAEDTSAGTTADPTEDSLVDPSLNSLTDSDDYLMKVAEEAEAEIQNIPLTTDTSDKETEAMSNFKECMKKETNRSDETKSPTPTVKKSYALDKIYKSTFGQEPEISHSAEADCITMLKIIRASCIHKFITWCDENAKVLGSVTPMY